MKTICYPTVHWTRPLLSDKLVGRMADREAEEKWREGGVAAKLSGIPHLVVAGWKEGEGEEGDSFQPFAPLFGKRLKKSQHVTDSKVERRTRSAKANTLPVRDWEEEGLTVLFCPLTWDKYHSVATFPFIYNSHPKKRMISNMDYSTSAAACWRML